MFRRIAYVLVFCFFIFIRSEAVLPEANQAIIDTLKERIVSLTTTPDEDLPAGLSREQVNELNAQIAEIESFTTMSDADAGQLLSAIQDQIGTDPEEETNPPEEEGTPKDDALEAEAAAEEDEAGTIPAPPFGTEQQVFTFPNPPYGAYPETFDPANPGTKAAIDRNVAKALQLRSRINGLMSNPNLASFRGEIVDKISTRLTPLQSATTPLHPSRVHHLLHGIDHILKNINGAYNLASPVDVTSLLNSSEQVNYKQVLSKISEEPKDHPKDHTTINLYLLAYRGDFPILRKLQKRSPHYHYGKGYNSDIDIIWSNQFGPVDQAHILTDDQLISGDFPGVTQLMKDMALIHIYAGNHDDTRRLIDGNNYYLYHMATPAGWFTPVELGILTDEMVVNAANIGVADRVPPNLLTQSSPYALFVKGTKISSGQTVSWHQVFSDGSKLKGLPSSDDGSPIKITQAFYGTGKDFNELSGIQEMHHLEFDGKTFVRDDSTVIDLTIKLPGFTSLWWYIDAAKANEAYRKNYHDAIINTRKKLANETVMLKNGRETSTGISRRVNATGSYLRQTNEALGWKNKTIGWFIQLDNFVEQSKRTMDGKNFHVAPGMLGTKIHQKGRHKGKIARFDLPKGTIEEECKLLVCYEDIAPPHKQTWFFVEPGHELPAITKGPAEDPAPLQKVHDVAFYGFGADFLGLKILKDETWIDGFAHYIYGRDIMLGYEMLQEWNATPEAKRPKPSVNNGPVPEAKQKATKKITSGFKSVGMGIKSLFGF